MSYSPASPIPVGTTNTPLLTGATYTSPTRQSERDVVLIQTFSDEQGALYVDLSVDGTNFDISYPVGGFLCKAGEASEHSAKVSGRYYRIRYVNNGTDQTVFRLGYFESTDGQARAALNQPTQPTIDATVVRPTVAQDEVLRGLRQGESSFSAVAERSDIDESDNEAFITSDNTTNTPTILTTASTFDISYNNGTDGSGNQGALILLFTYLDENQDIQSGVHVLGGTGSDTTTFSGLGINRVAVVSSGTDQVNVNDITITATTGGSVQSFIEAGVSFSKQALSHIPRNSLTSFKYLYFSAIKPSGQNPRVTFRLYVYSRIANTIYKTFTYLMETDAESSVQLVNPAGLLVNSGSVIYATAETSNNNTSVACTFGYNTYEDIT